MRLLKKSALLIFFSSLLFSACSLLHVQLHQPSVSPSPTPQVSASPVVLASPTPSPLATAADVRSLIDTGAAARESGDYQTGEQKLSQAFEDAIALKDSALAVEAGNNLSIQYRLSAGRANRLGQTPAALNFSNKSLAVYQRLKDLGWFTATDPNIARNWAHALLYAGKVSESIPALQKSFQLQKDAAAQGDETDHLAAAFLAQGKITTAQNDVTSGINLIQQYNGSKVWLTFGLMTKATILAQQGNTTDSQTLLHQALDIAQQNKLSVRQEEINYLLSLPPDKVNVLQAVMTVKTK